MDTARCLQMIGRGIAGAVTVAVVSYGTYVGTTWLGYGHAKPPAGQDVDPLLDRFMPTYDVAERRHISVDAPADVTLAAAYDLDMQRSAVVRAIFGTREVILRSRPEQRTVPQRLLEQMKALGWGVLAEVPGREIVVGAVTQPWKADVVFRALAPQEFAAFREPGYVKIAWTLRADPTGPTTSVARHETRAVATDPIAAARFRWYWATLSPGIKAIRYVALGLVKTEAEKRARQNQSEESEIDTSQRPATYAR
jgi:hypothetical protein